MDEFPGKLRKVTYVIAKHCHTSTSHIKQLEGVISDSHIVSFENALASEEEARDIEANFQELVTATGNSRRGVSAGLKRSGNGNYHNRRTNAILRYKKPVILLERMEQQKKEELESLFEFCDDYDQERLKYLGGQCSEAMDILWTKAENMKTLTAERDINMGENAVRCPYIAMNLYPELREKEELTYLVLIGAAHTPEVEIQKNEWDFQIECQVLELEEDSPSYSYLGEVYSAVVMEGASKSDCQDDMGRNLLHFAVQVAHTKLPLMPSKPSENDKDLLEAVGFYLVENMGAGNANELSGRLAGRQTSEKRGIILDYFIENGVTFPETLNQCRKYVRNRER